MSREWELKSIDEIAQISRGRSKHRPRNDPSLYGGSYPFVQTADIHASDLYIKSFSKTYSDLGLAQSKLWQPGVLCITNAGENTGDCAILDIEACFPDSIIAVTPDPLKSDIFFLKYSVDRIKHQLRSVTKGATQDNLSVSKLVSFKFPVPSLSTQKKIGSVLRTYGDLIENNRRRIQLLEESARLLYREWFVHLRFPGHEHVKIIDGVPEGWERKSIIDVAVVNQKSLSKSFQGEIQYIDIASVTTGLINEITSYRFEDAPSRARRIVNHGDIIWSCVRPNRQSHAIIWNPSEALIVSTGFAVITPITIPTSYIYQAVTTAEFVGYLSNNARGAAYPAVTASDFEKAEILIPTNYLVEAFNSIVETNIHQIYALQQQNQKLQQARDLLLPRLMNGEITL
jgi:type I restriction enzyme, S subunit